MARLKGRDVIIDLMDTVQQLQTTTEKHADLLETMALQAASMSARMTGIAGLLGANLKRTNGLAQRTDELAKRTNELAQRTDELAKRTNELAQRTDELASGMNELALGQSQLFERVTSLEGEFQVQAENATISAQLSRTAAAHVGRLATLLGRLSESTDSKLEALEQRVTKLERKTG